MNKIAQRGLLKELILISLGTIDEFSCQVSEEDWRWLFRETQKQSIVGVLFLGIKRLPENQRPPKILLIDWYGATLLIEQLNKQQVEKVKEISLFFERGGFRSCLLKGQGIALLYPDPFLRQCGDIDLWVEGSRDRIVEFCKKQWTIDHVDVKNMVVNSIPKVHLEVHFIPSWFYNPFTNKKFRNWYRLQWDRQFEKQNDEYFTIPDIEFNLVYCLSHIYKHHFDEGIGLRQMMDYYFILLHSTVDERNKAISTLKDLGMFNFAGAAMYVMKDWFAIEDCYLLCRPDSRLGKSLMDTILEGGNFGHYDERNAHGQENRLTHGIRNMRHNLRLLSDYPSEVIWSPLWKVWHWCWRKYNGYI